MTYSRTSTPSKEQLTRYLPLTLLNPCSLDEQTSVSLNAKNKERRDFYCCIANHFLVQCPNCLRKPASLPQAERTAVSSPKSSMSFFQLLSHQSFTLQVQIGHPGSVSVLSALVDSRATGNFTDHDTVKKLNLAH